LNLLLTEANRQAQATWNNRACGQRGADDLKMIAEGSFYEEMARRRYSEDDPWVPGVLDFPSMKGKHVLEIGHGMGCDLATAALHGAITHGIDLTPNHHEIAKQNFASLGLTGDFHLGNAAGLPFADQSMDIIYSLGVLHHMDNPRECITEAFRVLKPGGVIIVALYSFWSLQHPWIVVRGLLNQSIFRLGYRNLLSTVEAGADGITLRPLVTLYTARTLTRLLDGFENLETTKHGLAYRRIPFIGPKLSPEAGAFLERYWGWYLVGRARKPY
jgi:ubiquinone/menaquinone biosynthesis C-methylase UbiE